jgi:hypothetical protein
MSDVPLQTADAEVLVEARLGRRPQDMLEAAVALEAWVGLPAQTALATARALMRPDARNAETSVGRIPAPSPRHGAVLEGLALVMTVIAIACWAAPLSSSLGAEVVERGLLIALPLTLALQWGLRARYLDRVDALAQLADRRAMLLLGACAVAALPALAFGAAGALAGLLTVTWTAGTILVRRRWAAAYATGVLLATLAMVADAPALLVVAATAALTCGAVAFALRGRARPNLRAPGHTERTLIALAIGGSLGLMLVLDDTVSWTEGAVPALALLPSAVAAFWGGHHLRHLEMAIPRALSGISAHAAVPRRIAWPPLRVLLGALARLLALCAALSATLLALTPWLGTSSRSAGILAGFAVLAVATLLVSLLESMGRGWWALAAVGAAAAAEALVRVAGTGSSPGTGLLVGGTLAVVLALPAVVALLSRPASTLATALWIR